jgi:hypothetical protein
MKKIIIIIAILSLVLCSCQRSQSNENNTNPSSVGQSSVSPTPEDNIIKLTAEEIINKFKAANLPIDNIIVYTEETDENKLLGRPGSYTSKVNFADTRIDQIDKTDPTGGTIEVFENENDALKRKEYVDSVSSGIAFLEQYQYLYKNVLLRINHQLTTDQAAEYESALKNIK